jgi:hypothetical protein
MERCAAHPADTHLSGVTTPCAPIRPSRRTRTHAVNTHRARPRHPGSPRRVPAPPRVRTRPNSDLRSDRLTQADRPTTVDTLDVEGVMRGRLARQAILYQPEHHIVIALGEAALRNIHGDPDVRQQLGTCTSSPNNPRRASGGTRRIGLARPARVRSPRRPGHPRRRRRSTPHPLKSHQQLRSSRRAHPAHQRTRNAPVPSTQQAQRPEASLPAYLAPLFPACSA